MAQKDRKSAYEDKELTDAKWLVEGVMESGYNLEEILKELLRLYLQLETAEKLYCLALRTD